MNHDLAASLMIMSFTGVFLLGPYGLFKWSRHLYKKLDNE